MIGRKSCELHELGTALLKRRAIHFDQGVATDLRLNVVYTPPVEPPAEFDESFAIKASRTLVELLAHLKKAPLSDGEQKRP